MPITVLAYTDLGTILAGWAFTAGGIGVYAFVLVRRGKALSRAVAPEDRRWS